MGSTGTNNFTDYPGSSSSKSSNAGSGSNGSGGAGAQDRCSRSFSATLEDVAMADFYVGKQTLPERGTTVFVAQRKRLVAENAAGESIGSLPTQFNYLAGCMKTGWRYVGTVQAASNGPLGPTISVDFKAASA